MTSKKRKQHSLEENSSNNGSRSVESGVPSKEVKSMRQLCYGLIIANFKKGDEILYIIY